ncbi:MAG: EamA family transporter [Terriglobia bacterium]
MLSKVLLTGTLTPSQLVFYRSLLGSLVLLPILLWQDRPLLRISRRDLPFFFCMGVFGLAFTQYTYYAAIQSLDVGVAILLQYLAPLWILLFEHFYYRVPLTPSKVIALALALLGCFMISTGSFSLNGLGFKGLTLGLAAGVCFAAYGLMTKQALKSHHALTVLFYSLLLTALFWGIIGLGSRPSLPGVGLSAIGMIGYVAIFGTVVPYLVYLYALRLLEASRVGIISTLEPVFAAGIAWFYLGERLSILQLWGGAGVILAITILQSGKARE